MGKRRWSEDNGSVNVIRNTAKNLGSILFFSGFKGIFKFGHQKKLTILVKIGDWGHRMECVHESGD